MSSRAELARCPFVRAVAAGRIAEAEALANSPPDPAGDLGAAWLIAEARRQLAEAELEFSLDDPAAGPDRVPHSTP